ncbi:MAG: [FeFe] hydrogenase H-cluster radical SAM maturase HydE [Ruminococcus sp.]|nr:[FeFe] hydrogenase H-cluster radical SAM maturase HydE [Ruminococcus sp.]
MAELVDKLYKKSNLSDDDFLNLLESEDSEVDKILQERADEVRQRYYGKKVYLRGLIEISSYCKNNCYYCGIRRGNSNAQRYRLTPEQILECCKNGYILGFRTFVLQGGEDSYFTDELLCPLVSEIKRRHPDCAVTLSLGERSDESYRRLREAGADRYLLRHEAASETLYSKLHSPEMSWENRRKCLYTLKKLGYQVGAGFMVGAPFQTARDLLCDLRFMQELRPEMIGIGPFIPHRDTPFSTQNGGKLRLTLRLLGILRLTFPDALIPATTALGTIAPNGRELGLAFGCNVVMPNLSPVDVRKKYELYNDKICTGEEAAECRICLENRIKSAGYDVEISRGDHIKLYK